MSPASNLAADESGTEAAAGQCAALFEATTPALFVGNAFRVTGLAVDANPREIAEQISALKLRHRLGAAAEPEPVRETRPPALSLPLVAGLARRVSPRK